MLRRAISPLTLALVVSLAPAALPAQVTVGGAFGGLSGATNPNDAGTADWRLGWIGSVNGTLWLHRHVGLRY